MVTSAATVQTSKGTHKSSSNLRRVVAGESEEHASGIYFSGN